MQERERKQSFERLLEHFNLLLKLHHTTSDHQLQGNTALNTTTP